MAEEFVEITPVEDTQEPTIEIPTDTPETQDMIDVNVEDAQEDEVIDIPELQESATRETIQGEVINKIESFNDLTEAERKVLNKLNDPYVYMGSPTTSGITDWVDNMGRSSKVDVGALVKPSPKAKLMSTQEKVYYGISEAARRYGEKNDTLYENLSPTVMLFNAVEAISETIDTFDGLERTAAVSRTIENIKGAGRLGSSVMKQTMNAIPFLAAPPEVEQELNYFEQGDSVTASFEDWMLGYADTVFSVAFPLIRDYMGGLLLRPFLGVSSAGKLGQVAKYTLNTPAAGFIVAGAANNAVKQYNELAEYSHVSGREDINPLAMATVSFVSSMASGFLTNAVMSEYLQPLVQRYLKGSSVASQISAGLFGATENISDIAIQNNIENVARRKAGLQENSITGFEALLAMGLGAGFSMAANQHYVSAANEKIRVNPDGFRPEDAGMKTDDQIYAEGGIRQVEDNINATMVHDPKQNPLGGEDLSGQKISIEDAEGTVNEVLMAMAEKYNVHKAYNAKDVDFAETLIDLVGRKKVEVLPDETRLIGDAGEAEPIIADAGKITEETNINQQVNEYIKGEVDYTDVIEFNSKIADMTAEERTLRARKDFEDSNGRAPTEKELYNIINNRKKEDSKIIFFEKFLKDGVPENLSLNQYFDSIGIQHMPIRKILGSVMYPAGKDAKSKNIRAEMDRIRKGGEDYTGAATLMSKRYKELLSDYIRFTKYNALRNQVARKTVAAMMDIKDLDPNTRSIYMSEKEFTSKSNKMLSFAKAFYKTEMEARAQKIEESKANRNVYEKTKDFFSKTFDGVFGLEVTKYYGLTGSSSNNFMDSLNRIYDNVANPFVKEQIEKAYFNLRKSVELSISMANIQAEFIESFSKRLKSRYDTSTDRIRLYSDELYDLESMQKAGQIRSIDQAEMEYNGISMKYSIEAQKRSGATPEEMYLAHKISSFMNYRETNIVNPVNGKIAYNHAQALQNIPKFEDDVNMSGSYSGKTYSPVVWNEAGVKHLETLKGVVKANKNPNITYARNIDTARKDYTLREDLVNELQGDMLRARWRILNLNLAKEMQNIATQHYGIKFDNGNVKRYSYEDIFNHYKESKSDLDFYMADAFKLAEDATSPSAQRSDSKLVKAGNAVSAIHKLKAKFLTSGLNLWFSATGPLQTSYTAGADLFGLYGIGTVPKAYKAMYQYGVKHKFDIFSMTKEMEASGLQSGDDLKIGLAHFLEETFPYKGQKFYTDFSDAIDTNTFKSMHDELVSRGFVNESASKVVTGLKKAYGLFDSIADKLNNVYDAAEVGTRSHAYILGRGAAGKVVNKNFWKAKNLDHAVTKLDKIKEDLLLKDNRVFESIERNKLINLFEDAVADFRNKGDKKAFENFLHQYGSSMSLALNFEYNALTRPGIVQKMKKFGTLGKMAGMFTTFGIYNRKNLKRNLSIKDKKSVMGLLNLGLIAGIAAVGKVAMSEENFGEDSIIPRIYDTYFWSRLPVLGDLEGYSSRVRSPIGFAKDIPRPFIDIFGHAYGRITGDYDMSKKYLDDLFNYASPLRIMKVPGLTFNGTDYVEEDFADGFESAYKFTIPDIKEGAEDFGDILLDAFDGLRNIGDNIEDSEVIDFSETMKDIVKELQSEEQ